jgi:hypothetical protein
VCIGACVGPTSRARGYVRSCVRCFTRSVVTVTSHSHTHVTPRRPGLRERTSTIQYVTTVQPCNRATVPQPLFDPKQAHEMHPRRRPPAPPAPLPNLMTMSVSTRSRGAGTASEPATRTEWTPPHAGRKRAGGITLHVRGQSGFDIFGSVLPRTSGERAIAPHCVPGQGHGIARVREWQANEHSGPDLAPFTWLGGSG